LTAVSSWLCIAANLSVMIFQLQW